MNNNKKAMSIESTDNSCPVLEGLTVLVVDGDAACLTIQSRMLSRLGYKVMTAQRASDALYIVQEKEDELHLVLTEVHLPDMEKYELLEKMGRVSKLPVVIMSDDDDESAMLGGLFKGAVFYIVKPLTMNSLKSLWQFAFIKSRDAVTNFTEVESSGYDESKVGSTASNDGLETESVMKKEHQIRGSGKRKNLGRTNNDEERDNSDSTAQKKQKMVWTIELHKRFLQAVRLLGIDSAHPKKILQHMNVPDLRKEHVSSHLQKYRISLKQDQAAIMATRSRTRNESSFQSYPSSPVPFHLQGSSSQVPNRYSTSAAHQPEFRSHFQNSCHHMTRPSPASPVCFASHHVDSSGQPTLSNESSFPSCYSSSNHKNGPPNRSNQLPYTYHNYNDITNYGGQVGNFVVDANNFSNVADYGHAISSNFPTLLDSTPIEQEVQQQQQFQPQVLFSPPLQMPSPPPQPHELQDSEIFGIEDQLEPQVMLPPQFKMPSPPPQPHELQESEIFGIEDQLEPQVMLSPQFKMPSPPPLAAERQEEHDDILGLEKQFEPHVLLSPQWEMSPMPPTPGTLEQGGDDMFAIEDFDFDDIW